MSTATLTECRRDGCSRPVSSRGFCAVCYQRFRDRQIALRLWHGRFSTLGTARRLQALVALGYTQSDLCRRLGWNTQGITRLIFNRQATVIAKTAHKVRRLYDDLHMTPGPSQNARDFARRHGWAPPLAWNDDDIDDPTATPDMGEQTRVSFADRYLEMRDIGYREHEIARRLGIKAESLLRQVQRHGIPVSRELLDLANDEKRLA